ncbi:MAG: YihA family ribosome biogenesis GTP-binding protein [Tidjanibacter sp.]|nr:YihA family ribosome biogenesis GTP-binding protein [Tidjanibacter sp.]
MNITSAEFKFSSGKISQIPDHGKREFAFIGRSNVGKSSLVNMLTGRNLAKVSSTPGKTQHINHFLVNDSWWLVDLPGYGYARTSRNARESFAKIITDYVTAAPAMHYLFVLVDSRHEAMKIDLEFMQMLGREGVPFGIVFTKSDKLSARQLRLNVEAYKKRLSEWWEELPNIFITSSEHRKGRDEILDFIEECLIDC